MDAKALTPILNVSDLAESFAWFEKFGWRKCWDWGRPPSFGAVGSGECEIFLCQGGQGSRGHGGGPSTFGPGGDQTADKGVWMSVWVADVDEVHRRCVERGLEVAFPPENMPWGVREMHVRHPDGHVFRVSTGVSEQAPSREGVVTGRATGSFDVKLAPQAPSEGHGDPTVGRMAIDKRFHGDLEATSKGEMLATRTDMPGSAGYVAIERVTGTLHGRPGSFSLQHNGTMDRGRSSLTVTVVPDSATGELAGLAGRLAILVEEGRHGYDFEYTLPPPDRPASG